MVGGSKNVVFRMCLNLSDYQLKAICCVYRFMYINLTVNKPKIYNRYTHTKRKRNPNTTLKTVIISQEKRTKEEGKKKDLQKQSENN